MQKIYLDHSATTPADPEVLKAMLPYFSDKFGNASSIHSFGQEARAAVDNARHKIAKFLGCKSTEVIFTSGGSESDNLAIRGVIDAYYETQKSKLKSQNYNLKLKTGNTTIQQYSNITIPHIVTSEFEHHAVLDTIKELESDGKIEASFIKPNKEGLIEVTDVEAAIKKNTVLVSIIYVNNEIGTVQPIREIGKMIERINSFRHSELGSESNKKIPRSRNKFGMTKSVRDDSSRIFFHTDAVQAAEYFNMNVDYLHVDLLTMSAHKIYGPKGIGLLYIRSGVPINHQIIGGGQEYKKRAGTENVAGIVGMVKAIEITQKLKVKSQNYNLKVKTLRDKLIDGLLQIPDSMLNGSREHRSLANVNISFMNAEGESILLNLDLQGIAASTGSACTSGSLEPSHVLISMGLAPEECHGSIRFTLGRQTTKEEIDKVLQVMPKIVEKLRKMSPFS